MIINHNISALQTHRMMKLNTLSNDRVYDHLASAKKINRAGDDASGLAVSEHMRSQVRGLDMASRNTQDGISLIQTADGYLQDSQDLVQRLRELAVTSANGIYTEEDRLQLQVEVSQLVDELDRITSHAQFNAVNLFTGKYSQVSFNGPVHNGSMWFHLGANMDQRERLFINTMSAKALGLKNISTNKLISISTQNKANLSIGTIDVALSKISKQRADLGAYQNRLEHANKGIMVNSENILSSESRIRDADMALEMTNYIRGNVIRDTTSVVLRNVHDIQRKVVEKMVLSQ